MERDLETMELRLPSKLVRHLTALYRTPTERGVVSSMLRSVRYGHYDNAQVAVIGTAGDELLEAVIAVLDDWPPGVISLISELVGHALVWLWAPGLNVLGWSAASSERQKHSLRGGADGFGGDELFFNDYGCEKMVDWVDTLCPPRFVDLDLDWCFAVFLMLGAVPSAAADEENCCRLLNHKLMSGIPGNTPMTLCVHSVW